MHGMNVADLDLNLLVSLDALLETRSVTLAAQRVGLSQPAMSHALARLRTSFGDALLVRSRGQWTLTRRATQLVTPLQDALRGVRAVLAPPQDVVPATMTRTFTLAVADYGEFIVLPRLVAQLAREAPHVQVVSLPWRGQALELLDAGEADVWVGVNPPEAPQLYVQKLLSERYLCAVRRGHPLAKRTMTLKAFVGLKHVQIAPGGKPGGPLDDALAAVGLTRVVAVRVPHFLVAPHLVLKTDMVLTAPARILLPLERRLGLHLFEPPLTLPGFSLVQGWHARDHADPGHQWLRAQLLAAAAPAS